MRTLTTAVVTLMMVGACAGGSARPPVPVGPAPTPVVSTPAGLAPTQAPAGLAPAQGDPDWLTYHHDAAHSGTAAAAPRLVPAHPTWTSPRLDGDVYGEPLAADGLILVGTSQNTVYGLDPAAGTIRWSTHIAAPVPRSDLPCGDVDPLGILSTPVVDAGRHLLFVAAEEKVTGGVRHELVGLDTRTGAIVNRQGIDPEGMTTVTQQQRSSLTLDQGRVIVAFGGLYGDCGQFHGWLVSAPEDAAGPISSFHTPGNEVAFWSPGGPVVDGAGSIYVASGNGSSTTTYDDGEAVLKFSPSLVPEDSFTVTNWAADNAADADLGSAGPVLLGGSLLFQAGKRPTGYLLDTTHLGGVGGQAFAAPTNCASFGAPAWSPPDLYVPCAGGKLHKYRVDITGRTFAPAWTSEAPGEGPPVVGGGAVWTEDAQGGTLDAIDPTTGKTMASFATGVADHFSTPSIIGSEVVVAARRQLHAFSGPR